MAAPQPLAQDIYLTLHRTIDAPIADVYAAWTDPEIMRQWLAPGELAVARAVADVKVGGTFLVEMHGSDGEPRLTRGVYREVIPNRRLVHTWQWEGSEVESLVTVEFEAQSAHSTRLTLTHSRFADAAARDQHENGWSGCLAKLTALRPA